MTQLLDFCVCDDLRFEIGGKLTLVGLYTDGININALSPPAFLQKFTAFFRVLFAADRVPNAFRLRTYLDTTVVGDAGGAVVVGNYERPVAFALNVGPVPLEGPAKLQFELDFLRDSEVLETFRPVSVPITIGLALAVPAG